MGAGPRGRRRHAAPGPDTADRGSPDPQAVLAASIGRSLLEATLHRIAPLVPPARTLLIANRNHLRFVRAQLGRPASDHLLVQPTQPRYRAGDAGSPLMELIRRDAAATVVVFPSDTTSATLELPRACRTRRAAVDARPRPSPARHRPEWPRTGLTATSSAAHLQVAGAVSLRGGGFREKPSLDAAACIIARGGLWNLRDGVRAARMLELNRHHAAAKDFIAMHHVCRDRTLDHSYQQLDRWNFPADFLARIPEISRSSKPEHTDGATGAPRSDRADVSPASPTARRGEPAHHKCISQV